MAQAALVWGAVSDVATFIETGRIDVATDVGKPAPVTPDVAKYMAAIAANGGKFVMPDEVFTDG